MTNEEERYLRARVDDWRRRLPGAAKDIDTLLAEVDRRRAMIKRDDLDDRERNVYGWPPETPKAG